MTNKELIESIKKKTGFSKVKVERLLMAYVKTFDQFLDEDSTISLKGFGTFEPNEKQERKVYNPRTRQYKVVPKKRTVKFKPSVVLKNVFKG
jgi:DNA-binding protein HU-beta